MWTSEKARQWEDFLRKVILEENTDEGRGEIAFWQKRQTYMKLIDGQGERVQLRGPFCQTSFHKPHHRVWKWVVFSYPAYFCYHTPISSASVVLKVLCLNEIPQILGNTHLSCILFTFVSHSHFSVSQNSALLDAEMELAKPYVENIVISSYSEWIKYLRRSLIL